MNKGFKFLVRFYSNNYWEWCFSCWIQQADLLFKILEYDIATLTSILTLLALLCIWKSSHGRCPIKKALLKIFTIFTRKHLCCSLFLNQTETATQVFSYEHWEKFKYTYFEEHLRTAGPYNRFISPSYFPAYSPV